MRIIIIAAVAENNVIGTSSGEMPWHCKEEFQHFRNTTLGFPIIMGRKTFQSLKKPLKGRLNIILSRNKELVSQIPETILFSTINEAYDYCRNENYEKIFVIGGGHIFKDAIYDADEMIISRMNFKAEGDIFFPEIENDFWKVCKSDRRSEFTIYYYVKRINDC